MEKIILKNQPEKILACITIRTNNKVEMSAQGKIGDVVANYFKNNTPSTIPNRKNPMITIDGFTEYESDEHSEYTYFIGEEVSSSENLPADLRIITIPAGNFVKFTTEPGKMPDVIRNAWMKIWKMTPHELGGIRNYQCDYEVFDQRAIDPANTVVDIYIGIK